MKPGKKMGRPLVERPINHDVAARINRTVKAEELMVEIIQTAAKKMRATGNTNELRSVLTYTLNREHGEPVHHVNYMHDKPLDVNVVHSLSERMMLALDRADERVRNRPSK